MKLIILRVLEALLVFILVHLFSITIMFYVYLGTGYVFKNDLLAMLGGISYLFGVLCAFLYFSRYNL